MEKFCYYNTLTTPLGEFLLISDENKLLRAEFTTVEDALKLYANLYYDDNLPILRQAIAEVKAYFAGTLRKFTVSYRLETTEFRRRVWTELVNIPYGQTISYQTLAGLVGNPKASRAVGQANHHNPLTIIIPCHRVIGKNGRLVGYGGGLDKKEWLLNWEAKCVREDNDT
ncbi:MAG: methylated-DNA--[protein]-cysteine S-methyltransferase [Peptococcia bacterium]